MKFTSALVAILAITNVEAINKKAKQEPAPPLSSIGLSIVKAIYAGGRSVGETVADNMTNETKTPYTVQYPAHK